MELVWDQISYQETSSCWPRSSRWLTWSWHCRETRWQSWRREAASASSASYCSGSPPWSGSAGLASSTPRSSPENTGAWNETSNAMIDPTLQWVIAGSGMNQWAPQLSVFISRAAVVAQAVEQQISVRACRVWIPGWPSAFFRQNLSLF